LKAARKVAGAEDDSSIGGRSSKLVDVG
jgi:hypothetical protein